MIGKSYVPYTPVRVMYQVAVVLVGLFLMAFLWYALYSCINPLRLATVANMEQFENMTSYPSYTLADTFMANLWLFFVAIAGVGLLYWSWIYGQRKNAESGYR